MDEETIDVISNQNFKAVGSYATTSTMMFNALVVNQTTRNEQLDRLLNNIMAELGTTGYLIDSIKEKVAVPQIVQKEKESIEDKLVKTKRRIQIGDSDDT